MKQNEVIPVMYCFDDNYAMPAAVAFLSMLEHADRRYFYKLYVLHSDITAKHREMLQTVVSAFPNASLEFMDMENKFDDLFEKLKSKAHYSKEMFYKFLPPRLFPDYDKIIITDVDVVYQGDISKDFADFNVEDDYYLAAHRGSVMQGTWLEDFYAGYDKNFTPEEKSKIYTNAGCWIFNLKKMRADDMSEKFIHFASENITRLLQPEQDTVNLVCAPKIKLLPANAVVCTYTYEMLEDAANFQKDIFYSAQDLAFALQNPIQIHYATGVKPWKDSSITKAKLWFDYLFKTPFTWEYIESREHKLLWNNPLFYRTKKRAWFKALFGKIFKLGLSNVKPVRRGAVRPLVSVLCCSYNHENYIAAALESIVNQKTDFPLEVIVSDDASTDKTQSIIRQYAQKYPGIIKAVLRDKNVGVGENCYEALKKVSGKYLAICDGDDCWLDEHKLQKQITFMEAHPDFAVCCSDVRWHYADGNKKDEIFKVKAYMPKKMRQKSAFAFKDLLHCRFIASSTCVLRWTMKNNVPVWLKKHCVIDFPLTLVHSMVGKIKVFDEVFAQYNIHAKGVSRKEQTALYQKKMNDILRYVDDYTGGYHSKEIKKFIEQTQRGR